MTSSNRTQVASVLESVIGEAPVSPRLRNLRLTAEALTGAPEFVDSDEIRDDRMMGDPIKVMTAAGGTTNHEFSYPVDNGAFSDHIICLMYNPWKNTPVRDNDGTADSVITGIVGSTGVVSFTTGDSFITGALVRLSGFADPANNGVFLSTAGGATSVTFGAGANLVDDAAPAGTARVKTVGVQGAAGDIVAVADGLTSTTLDFTTLNLRVGQWVKIGGTADITQFATLVTAGVKARRNAYGRVIAIAAGKLTLDALPAEWGADAGTGKTINIFFGDTIKNGTTEFSLSLQKSYKGQAAPNYFLYHGMHVNTWDVSIQSRDKITGSFSYMGMAAPEGLTPLDANPDPAGVEQVMAANANVGSLYESGQRIQKPNWAQSISFQINNNLRTNESVDEDSPVAVREGEFAVTGSLNTYFGSRTLLAKFYSNAPTSLATRIGKNNQAVIFQVPRAIYRGGGNPSATAKNTDVMLPLEFQASKDPLTEAHFIFDRFEYVED